MPKSASSKTHALRLPAHLNYLTSHSYHGTNCCQSFSISCIYHRPSNSVNSIDQYGYKTYLPSTRLRYSCTRSNDSHNHAHAHNKSTNVIVLCMDFSKAFETVRHSTLLEKLAHLDIPAILYTTGRST